MTTWAKERSPVIGGLWLVGEKEGDELHVRARVFGEDRAEIVRTALGYGHFAPVLTPGDEDAIARTRRALADADRDGYGKTGWYSYIARADVERILGLLP